MLQIVVADDSVLLREGVVRLLVEAGFEVAGQAGTAEALVEIVRATKPDLAIVDIRMPPGVGDEGIRASRALRAEHGLGLGVLILSQYLEADFALRLLEEGGPGMGYLLKDRIADVDQFLDAVRRVATGEQVVDPAIVRQLIGRPRKLDPVAALSDREREVLALMAEGRSNAAIADRLFLSAKTVEAYVGVIFGKLGLEAAPSDHRRVLAVLAYLQER